MELSINFAIFFKGIINILPIIKIKIIHATYIIRLVLSKAYPLHLMHYILMLGHLLQFKQPCPHIILFLVLLSYLLALIFF